MFDNLFKKTEDNSPSGQINQDSIKIAVVNQNYNISNDFYIRNISNGLYALIVLDGESQVRSVSRSDLQMNEQDLFDLALRNTGKAGIKDENDLITISNGNNSIDVFQFDNNDYFLTSFIFFDLFFNQLKNTDDVLFACPSRSTLLVLPLKSRTKSNAGDLILFGLFVFETYTQAKKRIRPDVYYWYKGRISCVMKYDDNEEMKEIDSNILETICARQ